MLAVGDGPQFVLKHASSLVSALDWLPAGHFEVVLLDLFLPDSQGLETLNTIRIHAPDMPVLIWTSLESPQLAQAALQAGAQDFLIRDRLTAASLVRSLQYAVLRRGAEAASPDKAHSEVIGVLGAKGGVGATTLACHLSAELRRITGQDVLLVDLDLYAGQIAFLTKTKSAYSILDAANNLNRLDADYWGALVALSATGVSVVRSPALPEGESVVKVERLRHVMRFIKSQYRWAVVDLGRMSALSVGLVPGLDAVMLVVTPEVQALFEAKSILAKLSGIPRERIHLVINRHTSHALVAQAQVEKMLGQPVYATLPNNYAALNEAYTNGTLLAESTNLGRQIGRLAARIAGMEESPKKRQGTLMSYLRGSLKPAPKASGRAPEPVLET
jgi:pilus assembly protein CpaE